jgi:hypothetical protein
MAAVVATTTTETRSLATADAPAPDQAPVTTVAPANSKKAFASTATRRATSASIARKVAAAAAVAAVPAAEALPETEGRAAAAVTCATGEIASENAETTVASITGRVASPESTAVKTVRATRDQPAPTRGDPHAEAAAATTKGGAAAAAWKSIGAGVSTAPTTAGADRPDGGPTEAKTISMSEIPLTGDQYS